MYHQFDIPAAAIFKCEKAKIDIWDYSDILAATVSIFAIEKMKMAENV